VMATSRLSSVDAHESAKIVFTIVTDPHDGLHVEKGTCITTRSIDANAEIPYASS
jgi:hypothetical protein